MQITVLTPVWLLRDDLAACFKNRQGTTGVVVVSDLPALRDALQTDSAQIVLVDVSQRVDLFDVRAIALEWPDSPLVALGLTEQKQDIIKCGRAGFAGYVARDASIEGLYNALSDIHERRLACPPEIAGCVLRVLFRKGPDSEGLT